MNAGFRQCGLPSSYLRNRRVANRGPAHPGAQKKERAQGPFFMLPMHRASGNQNASVLSL
jgi:hypothetical protein